MAALMLRAPQFAEWLSPAAVTGVAGGGLRYFCCCIAFRCAGGRCHGAVVVRRYPAGAHHGRCRRHASGDETVELAARACGHFRRAHALGVRAWRWLPLFSRRGSSSTRGRWNNVQLSPRTPNELHKHHVFSDQRPRRRREFCQQHDAQGVRDYAKGCIKTGAQWRRQVRINNAGCMDRCSEGR